MSWLDKLPLPVWPKKKKQDPESIDDASEADAASTLVTNNGPKNGG